MFNKISKVYDFIESKVACSNMEYYTFTRQLLDYYILSLESFINSYVEVAVHRKYPICLFISKTLIKYLL